MARKKSTYRSAIYKKSSAAWHVTRDFVAQYAWWEIYLLFIGFISFTAVAVILILPLGSGPANPDPCRRPAVRNSFRHCPILWEFPSKRLRPLNYSTMETPS